MSIRMRHNINEMLEQFRAKLLLEEKSKNTVEKYLRDTKKFLQYIAGEEITKPAVLSYKQYLLDSGYAERSINSMLASVKHFLKSIGKVNMSAKSIRIQQKPFCESEKELTREEYIRLLNEAESEHKLRLSMMLQTICATGIRVSELKYITVKAVRKGEVKVNCKGKVRLIMIIKSLQKKLLAYIREQRIEKGMVFITKSGQPLNRSNIWREMKRICKAARVNPKKVFPHNLRHLFARCFYAIDKDLAKLADILGHASINTTRIYLTDDGREHRKKLEMLRLIV